MQRYSGRLACFLGGMLLLACTFSIALKPNPSATLAVPTRTLTAMSTLTQTASTMLSPTATHRVLPVTPWALDPESEVKGKIVFEKGMYGGDGIYTVLPKATGNGVLKFLYRSAVSPQWSADGEWIAMDVLRIAPASEFEGYGENPSIPNDGFFVDDIAVIQDDGSQFTMLTQMKAGERLWEFVWSPDGQWIAVIGNSMEFIPGGGISYSDANVSILKTDGSGTMQRIGDTMDLESHVDWLPDSKHIVYLEPGGLLVIASIETGKKMTVGTINFPGINSSKRVFDVSSDGKFLAYLEVSGANYHLHVVPLEGFQEGDEPEGFVLFSEAVEAGGVFTTEVGDLSISPDGARMLFVVSAGGKSTLRLFSLENAAPIILAELTDCISTETGLDPQFRYSCWSPNWTPGWSSDGQWIMYATAISGSGWESGDLYILNVAQAVEATINPILQVIDVRCPHWQPVGL